MSNRERLRAELASGKISAEGIAELVVEDPLSIEILFHGLSDYPGRVRFGCSKAIMILSEKWPELVYPEIERVVELLDSGNRILKWNAIAVLGNLAAADRNRRIPEILPRLYGLLSGGELITANNAILALSKIGCAFPEAQPAIASQLLRVEQAGFPTNECRSIAIGKAILAIRMFADAVQNGLEIRDFARRHSQNTRPATAEKARSFLRSRGPQTASTAGRRR